MRPTAQQHQRAPDGASVHYERHRPAQTTLYCLVQQHAASFVAYTEASTGAEFAPVHQGRIQCLPGLRHPGQFLGLRLKPHRPVVEGPGHRPGLRKHHLAKTIAALMVLPDSMLQGNWVDDRPPRGLADEDMDKLNAEASAPINRYGDRNPCPYTIQHQLRAGC